MKSVRAVESSAIEVPRFSIPKRRGQANSGTMQLLGWVRSFGGMQLLRFSGSATFFPFSVALLSEKAKE
jgi:hypothetical protein